MPAKTRSSMNRTHLPIVSALLALLAMLSIALPARAQASLNPTLMSRAFTQGEWAVLPSFCIDTQAGPYGGPEGGSGLNRSPRASHWVSLMGTDFWNMHHYCYALRDLRRVDDARATARDKVALYGRAEDDLGYVIKTCQPTMPLMPEVLLKLGDINVAQGDLPGAQSAFERARELKPDYWPAYTRWIDILIGLKQASTARALTEEGLRQAPDSAELRERAAKLGLKLAKTDRAAQSSADASSAN